MLLHYHVKNFALIEDASVDFGPGLNVLTGETGAGKSIMIDALNAAMGARTGTDMIRRGAEEAFVELLFSLEDEALEEALRALDIACEEHTLLLSRRISAGRSLYKINEEVASQARVRAVTALLVDLHGQHEHQSLMDEKRHLGYLDASGDEDHRLLLEKNQAEFQAWNDCRRALEKLKKQSEQAGERLELLRKRKKELN